MDGYALAWIIYGMGALGCGAAAWLMFRRFGREWASFFCVSVLALLLTPYAVDAEQMLMAPAIFFIVFEAITEGFESVIPIIMVVSGVWLAGLVISLILHLIARRLFRDSPTPVYQPVPSRHEDVEDVHDVHEDDLPTHDIPLRAER